MLDFIKKIVSSMKNKSSGGSGAKYMPSENSQGGTGDENGDKPSKAIVGILAVVSIISIGVAIAALIHKHEPSRTSARRPNSPEQPVPGPNPSKPPVSPVLPPKELESYWDLRNESNCSSGKVNVPSGYATLICEISDRDMKNVFVFSWNSVKQANKSNKAKDQIDEHQVYFVPINYRWELGSNSKIKHEGGEREIHLIKDPLSYKDKARQNFEHAMQGKTDVFYIGMASREGNLQIEEERARLRGKILHEAFYAFLPNPQYTNEYVLSLGKYDDRKCRPLNNSSEERPILIAMISGSGEYRQDVTYLLVNRIQPDLPKVDAILQKMEEEIEEMKKNSSISGSSWVDPSCYSRGKKPEVILIPPS